LYPYKYFTEHLMVVFEKSPRKNDLNHETSSLLIQRLKSYTDFSLQRFTQKSTQKSKLLKSDRADRNNRALEVLGAHKIDTADRIKSGVTWRTDEGQSLRPDEVYQRARETRSLFARGPKHRTSAPGRGQFRHPNKIPEAATKRNRNAKAPEADPGRRNKTGEQGSAPGT
jgi:hypothetical protein